MANIYTENEYNSYIIIIISPQLNNGDSSFLAEVEDIWLLYKVYKTIPVSTKSLEVINK